jgi:hypothetical protein
MFRDALDGDIPQKPRQLLIKARHTSAAYNINFAELGMRTVQYNGTTTMIVYHLNHFELSCAQTFAAKQR